MGKSQKTPATQPPTPAPPQQATGDTLWDRGNAFAQEQMTAARDAAFGAADTWMGWDATGDAYLDEAWQAAGDAMPDLGGGEAPAPPAGVLRICAKPGSPAITYEGIVEQGEVGHAWVEFDAVDGSSQPSWGFWPDDPYSTDPMDSWVSGRVHSPDEHSGERGACREAWITADQLAAVEDYAASHASSDYSVFQYNCTDFAVGAYEAAGQDAPSAGTLGIDFPHALRDGIVERNKRDGLDRKGDPVTP